MITKTLQKKEDFFIQFTDEEMEELGMKKNSKFTVKMCDNGKSFMLIPFEEIQLDLSEYSKEDLINLIYSSNAKDQTVEEFIVDTLEEFVKQYEEDYKCI